MQCIVPLAVIKHPFLKPTSLKYVCLYVDLLSITGLLHRDFTLPPPNRTLSYPCSSFSLLVSIAGYALASVRCLVFCLALLSFEKGLLDDALSRFFGLWCGCCCACSSGSSAFTDTLFPCCRRQLLSSRGNPCLQMSDNIAVSLHKVRKAVVIP